MQNEESPRRSSGKRRPQWVGRAPSPPPVPLSWHLCPGMHNCVKGIEKPLKTHLKCSETCLSLHPRLTHLLAPVAGLGVSRHLERGSGWMPHVHRHLWPRCLAKA